MSKAYSGKNLTKLFCIRLSKNFSSLIINWIFACCSSYCSNSNWNLNNPFKEQFSILFYNFIMSNRRIFTRLRGMNMNRCLNSSPVLSCCYTYTINSIQYPFIMGCSSKFIKSCKIIRLKNFLSNFIPIGTFPSKLLNRNFKPTTCHSFWTVITKYSYSSNKSHSRELIFKFLTQSIDDICSHCFTNIN